jgi:hypothetical protein
LVLSAFTSSHYYY